jgi:carbonic anhydrase
MDRKMNLANSGMPARIFVTVLAAVFPATVPAAWQTLSTNVGRHVEIDRESVVPGPDDTLVARGRIVLDKSVVDPKTSTHYRVIEIESHYDCAERTYATLKRAYYREDGSLLRQDETQNPIRMPVRSGTPDDRLLREVCRPKNVAQSPAATLGKIDKLSANLRKSNEALIKQAVKNEESRRAKRSAKDLVDQLAAASGGAPVPSPAPAGGKRGTRRDWAYEGENGPGHWSELSPDYALCAKGRRQSPIAFSESIAVDLEPIRFFYEPAPFRVVDAGRHLQVTVYGGNIQVLGKDYRLSHVRFHKPSEFVIFGRGFDMEAQLFHRSEEGQQAIVSVLLERGVENKAIQTVLNHLPLEKGGEVAPPGQTINLDLLLPANRGYYTFMGSLTTPPCTEDVLWMVVKRPQQMSPGQMAIFQRLYPYNARPVQPAFGRIVKESR